MTLTEFLLARIAEDAAFARHVWPERFTDRQLAECESKRRIVAASDAAADAWSRTSVGAAMLGIEVLSALALPYADHPDYDEEWKP